MEVLVNFSSEDRLMAAGHSNGLLVAPVQASPLQLPG